MIDRLTVLELIADVASVDMFQYPEPSDADRKAVLAYLTDVLRKLDFEAARNSE